MVIYGHTWPYLTTYGNIYIYIYFNAWRLMPPTLPVSFSVGLCFLVLVCLVCLFLEGQTHHTRKHKLHTYGVEIWGRTQIRKPHTNYETYAGNRGGLTLWRVTFWKNRNLKIQKKWKTAFWAVNCWLYQFSTLKLWRVTLLKNQQMGKIWEETMILSRGGSDVLLMENCYWKNKMYRQQCMEILIEKIF